MRSKPPGEPASHAWSSSSSNHVVGMYEHDEPYASVVAGRYERLDPDELPRLKADAPTRPDGPYGVGKAFGEAAGRYYSEAFGLSVICLRIGTVTGENRPEEPRHFATMLTHRDLVHQFGYLWTSTLSPMVGHFSGCR